MRLWNQRGFSLIEVMIVAALLGVLAYFSVGLTRNSVIGQKTASSMNEARDITSEMATVLTAPNACLATFGGLVVRNGPTISQVKNSAGGTPYVVGSIYGNKTVKLMQIKIGGSGTDAKSKLEWYTETTSTSGLALVMVTWNKNGETTGAAALPRFFYVNVVTDGAGHITECAATGMADTIWQRNPSDRTKIYYNDGNVGIGSIAPRAALEVTGAVRAGNFKVGDACDLEGATGYDTAAHVPVYCNEKGKWASSKGLTSCVLRSTFGAYTTSRTCKADEVMTGAGGGTNSTYHYLGGYYTIPNNGPGGDTLGGGAYTNGGNWEAIWFSSTFVICCK